jgi:hypothetical protein
MHTYNPYEGEPRYYNNPQILHHRVQQELLLQIKFRNIHKQVLLEFNSAAGNKIVLTMIQDIIIKPVHDIIQRYYRSPGTHPIPPTNQEEEYTAKSN